jgi:hypothetical protein
VTPLALVVELNFDKNPRLATVVGFLLTRGAGHNRKSL